ncbi:biotin transporter BioY [Henriciella sp.]|jgi:biotin transport system substrate-specific component|uniref:biotin transporter BioY n=1 Tax=Henriciella sp. TaxID=1968823 RepID=UPI000C105326|nr:biotin transporter BioY [Henriciella sp.]PHR75068.1 MAG: biotin transporter BioY [Henriciella sp.]
MQTNTLTDHTSIPRQIAFLLAGVGVLTASSYVAVPMVPVPVTMQTLAVLLVGAVAGPRMGLAMIVSWLALAATGLPVLAGGKAGLLAFTGPTAGFLLAFPAAGFLAGVMTQTLARGHISRALSFLGLHGLILMAGWAWLATLVGAEAAFTAGVAPFLVGAVIKSALGAAVLAAIPARWRAAR